MWLNVRWLTHAHLPLFVTSALFNKSWTAASSAGLQPRGGRTNIRYKAGVGIKTACSPWLFDGGWSAQCGADNWSNEPFIYCTDILTSTKGSVFFIHAEWCTHLAFIVKVLFAAVQPWLFLSGVFLSADLLAWLLLCPSRYRSSPGESQKPEERATALRSWESRH